MVCASLVAGSSGAAAPAAPAAARIELDAAERQAPISRRLFGKFTEHLGTNVYQGAWAQVVLNPEFAPATRWADAGALRGQVDRLRRETGIDGLAAADAACFAPFWTPVGAVVGRLATDGRRDVQQITAADGGELRTPVFLPLGRVRTFDLTLKARAAPAEGGAGAKPAALRVAILMADGTPAVEAKVALAAAWTESKVRLAVPETVPFKPGDAMQLALRFDKGTAVDLARVLLFPSDHLSGWDPEVVAYMRQARLPLLRFPGGNFASTYHWKDGVGPLDDRPVLPNRAWPNVIEFNHVGTDEWLRLCELTGAEPMVCINAGSGTPEEARDWVLYCNAAPGTPMAALRAANGHPEPYNVRLWELGNELYGDWQEGHTDAEGYADRYVRFHDAMAPAGRDLLFIANGNDEPWNAALVRKAGPKVRCVAGHFLIGGGLADTLDPTQVFEQLMAFSAAFGDEVRRLCSPMVKAGLRPHLAVTELQVFTNRPRLPNNATMAEAVWTADITNASIRSEGVVELITHSALVNHGGGLRKRRGIVFANPVWWTTHLYASQDGVIPTAARVESPAFAVPDRWGLRGGQVPCLGAAALLNEAGDAWALFVVNRSPLEAVEAEIVLKGFPAGPSAEVITVAGKDCMAANSLESPSTVAPRTSTGSVRDGRLTHTFPPASLTRITFRRE